MQEWARIGERLVPKRSACKKALGKCRFRASANNFMKIDHSTPISLSVAPWNMQCADVLNLKCNVN